MRLNRPLLLTGIMILILRLPSAFAQGEAVCGSLENGYGPYDYRTDVDKLNVVERYHFTPEVEGLLRGKSTIVIGADIAYTLNAFPNHHRALMAMAKLAQKEKTERPKGSRHSMSCWFERAERFRPDDAMVRVIHGLYLIQAGRSGEAIQKLELAARLDNSNPNVHYNLGLAYFNLGQYEKALLGAHRAYAAGFPLPGLRNMLKRAGKWREDAGIREERTEVEKREGATAGPDTRDSSMDDAQ